MKRIYPLIFLIIIFGSISALTDEHPQSTSYLLLKGHFTSAGGTTSSSNYKVISALGQISPVGKGQSSSYILYSGIFTPIFASYNNIPSILSLTALPQADFNANSFPYNVTFYVTVYDVDSSVFDYIWDFGDGETAQYNNEGTTLTITHQFLQAKSTGPYQVTCTVSDKLSSTYEMIDIYLGPQAPKVSIEAYPQYGSRPLTVAFTGSATDPDNGTVTNYEWDFGDGSAHQSGATLTSVNHTYSAIVTATTVYTATLYATDNDARVGTATQKISYVPSLFFDDFEDGDASNWTQYQFTDWTVTSNVTNMLKSASDNTARHITAPIPGGLISYGAIRVDMYLPSTSTTELKTGMIIWAFNNYQDYRYIRLDRTAQKVYFGLRAPGDIDKAEFAANGWSIPVDQVFNVELIFRPDGVTVAKINNVTVGSYDYLTTVNGGVGLATRKSETYYDNFLVSQYADTNLPPNVTIDPEIFVANIYPATVNFTVSAFDPDGEDSDLLYFWNFGDGNTSNNKNTANSYFSEGLFVATMYVTDSGSGVNEPETTTAYSFVNVGVDFYDNFNDGNFSDWTVGDTGVWSIVNGELTTSTDDNNYKIFAPYPASSDLGYAMACTKFNIQPKTTNTKQNAIMITGYRDANMDYRFVKFDNDTNSISIMHDDAVILEQTDATTTHKIPLGTDIFACVKVEMVTTTSDKVTVYYDGKQILTYTYNTHWSGKWGLRAGKSYTKFDDYIIYDPSTSNSTAPDIDTNFKDINLGEVRTDSSTGQTVQLVIYNKAPLPLGENLNITSFVFNNTDFTVEDPATNLPITSLSTPIPAGGQATVQVRYKPAAIELDSGQLKIYNDDPDESQYIVNFQGEGVKSLKPVGTISLTPSSGVGPIPLTVNFSASATDPDGDDNLITYQWNFGDGSSLNNNMTCTHTYLTIGEYTVTLVLTDYEGQTNSYTKKLTAEYYYFLDTFNDSDISNWTPKNTASWTTYSDSGEIRLRGKNLTLQDDLIAPAAANFTGTGIIEYDAIIASSTDGTNIMINFDYINSSNYSLIHFKPYGSVWYLRKVIAGVNSNLQSGALIVNTSQWNNYKAEFVNGVISLSVNDQSIVTGINYGTFSSARNGISIQNTNASFDNYKVTFTNMSSINQPPTLTINADPTSGYSPQEITFTANANDPDGNSAFLTYRWNFGDSSGTSSAQNPIYTYTTTGSFTATCTVTDSGTPAMSTAQTIVIDIAEGNHPPNVTIQGNPVSGKPPLNVTFTSTVTDDENNTPFSYSWEFGDGSSSTQANPTHTYTVIGQYTATLTATDSGSPARSGKATLPIDVSNWITIFEDNYNDNNYTGWTPSSSSLWFMYNYGTGEYALNGQAKTATTILAPTIVELKEGNTVEYDFNVRSGQAVVKLNSGLVFDYRDSANYSLIMINGNTPSIQLQRIVSGIATTLNTGTIKTINYNTWYHFKAILRNNLFTVEIDGVKAIDSYNYGTVAATRVGLYVIGSSVLFDNFIVMRDASLDGNTAPAVSISANILEGTPPAEITFTSTVTDKENDIPLTYNWNFGDGSTNSNEENPIHTFTATGQFTVTCSVTDSGDPHMTGSDTLNLDITNYSTVFTDNFNDGNISDWNNLSGTIWSLYQVATNSYRLAGVTTLTGTILAPTAAEFNNGNIIEYDFLFRSGQVANKKKFGFYFDYQSSTNYTLVRINYEVNVIQIYKYVNGSGSLLFSGNITAKAFDTWSHFKASMTSGNLTIYIDGTKVVNGYNYGTITSNTNGLWVWESSMYFDDFIVKELVP